jgi:DNA ligase-1
VRSAPGRDHRADPAAAGGVQRLPLHHWISERLLPLRTADEALQREQLLACWAELGTVERFVFNKLITGGFRVGVSALLVQRALAQVSGVDARVIAHRMAGDWAPTAENYSRLVSPDSGGFDQSQPYPFFLAHPVEGEPARLGDIGDWQAEDGSGMAYAASWSSARERVFLWSRAKS